MSGGKYMKRKAWGGTIIAVIIAVIIAIMIIIMVNSNSQTEKVVEKSYNDNPIETTLYYNGKKYYELGNLSDYYASQGKKIPNSINNFGVYNLFVNERMDLSEYTAYLFPDDSRWIEHNTYYIYKNDSKEHPIVIFEKNNMPLGPSDGWYYFSEDFEFQMPTVRTDLVYEILLTNDTSNILWSTNHTEEIKQIISALQKSENICCVLNNYTNVPWKFLYVRYSNNPFVENIGWQDNGCFILNNTGDNTVCS